MLEVLRLRRAPRPAGKPPFHFSLRRSLGVIGPYLNWRGRRSASLNTYKHRHITPSWWLQTGIRTIYRVRNVNTPVDPEAYSSAKTTRRRYLPNKLPTNTRRPKQMPPCAKHKRFPPTSKLTGSVVSKQAQQIQPTHTLL